MKPRRPSKVTKVGSADGGAFRKWLKDHAKLSHRASTDVMSRARRALAFVDVLSPSSDGEMALRLRENEAYLSCSVTVRSQIRRAAVLFRRFKQRTRGRASR